jgi:hypothetical protein
MKQLLPLHFLLCLLLAGCREDQLQPGAKTRETGTDTSGGDAGARAEIQHLMRRALKWSQSVQAIDLYPMQADSAQGTYTGFNLDVHDKNLKKLRITKFFSAGFIRNYDQIILTLDKKLKAGEFGKWRVNDPPPFTFANDVDPWCLCQDVPYFEPWDLIEVEPVRLSGKRGELYWTWGSLGPNADPGWKQTAYLFRVVKEDNRWKIDYLQGFDFAESTRTGALASNQ